MMCIDLINNETSVIVGYVGDDMKIVDGVVSIYSDEYGTVYERLEEFDEIRISEFRKEQKWFTE